MASPAINELERIERKRELLEKLLAFARQLARLQGGVETLQQMLKPSQTPGRKSSAIADFCTQLARHDTADLQQKLQALDGLIARELDGIITLSKLSQDEFIAQYASGAADDLIALETKLIDFRRKGQINVAMRYLLHERGAKVEAARLPVTQEQISERLDSLRSEELRCRSRIRDEISAQMADIRQVLADPKHPESLKQQFAPTLTWLQQGLDLLASGGKLDELPVFIETVVMADERPPPLPTMVVENVVPTETTDVVKPAPLRRKMGFWRRLQIWINTPWGVRWKDIGK